MTHLVIAFNEFLVYGDCFYDSVWVGDDCDSSYIGEMGWASIALVVGERTQEEHFFVKEKVPKAKPSTCVRSSLIRWVVNRVMCTSGRDLKERANRPTPKTDSHNISVKICPTRESNLRCRRISPHVTSSLTNSPMPLRASIS
ncbi:Uncharacterized protein Fot_09936 [Forsythia ovata]|uniref:Uncharacterized protein n=1 Tax=Forsythia ovata TaxID=205694 RepID=A0ABD1WFT5_9LAMI